MHEGVAHSWHGRRLCRRLNAFGWRTESWEKQARGWNKGLVAEKLLNKSRQRCSPRSTTICSFASRLSPPPISVASTKFALAFSRSRACRYSSMFSTSLLKMEDTWLSSSVHFLATSTPRQLGLIVAVRTTVGHQNCSTERALSGQKLSSFNARSEFC